MADVNEDGTGPADSKQTALKPSGKIDAFDNNDAIIASWVFYDAWVNKVSGLQFTTEGADKMTFATSFVFYDFDAPFYGRNKINPALGAASD